MRAYGLPAILLSYISVVFATQAIYDQCAGKLWTGDTTCVDGTTCQYQNPCTISPKHSLPLLSLVPNLARANNKNQRFMTYQR